MRRSWHPLRDCYEKWADPWGRHCRRRPVALMVSIYSYGFILFFFARHLPCSPEPGQNNRLAPAKCLHGFGGCDDSAGDAGGLFVGDAVAAVILCNSLSNPVSFSSVLARRAPRRALSWATFFISVKIFSSSLNDSLSRAACCITRAVASRW